MDGVRLKREEAKEGGKEGGREGGREGGTYPLESRGWTGVCVGGRP